ncbi:MAG: 50S ribosomal protein L30 [Candidatus Aenigmarchaeota archaeon]|nr:50S ribosomal protein L30 [Candidatus Aenigmarchaeota archaeon]MBU5688977.1 50S ribosomal protein L30 [Candidatus Aenigmarchaeota archaeon]
MFAVVRIRGWAKTRKEINDTLEMLKLKRNNNCVLIPETPQYKGMLNKVKDYVTFGEIEKDVLVELLEKRCEIIGGKLTKENIKEITKFDSFEKFAQALLDGKVKLKDFKKIKPVFRLNPPRKGFRSKRLPYPKGDLGYRGKDINEFLKRMI